MSVFLTCDHVPADRTGSVLNPQFRLKLHRDSVLTPPWIIGLDFRGARVIGIIGFAFVVGLKVMPLAPTEARVLTRR